jgi:hypothetical protein
MWSNSSPNLGQPRLLGRQADLAKLSELFDNNRREAVCLQASTPSPMCLGSKTVGFFIHVWNEQGARRTTSKSDVHAMLAVLSGLSAEEIMVQPGKEKEEEASKTWRTVRPPQQRMLGILRSRGSLPLSMILRPCVAGTPLCKGYECVPHFPSLHQGRNSVEMCHFLEESDGVLTELRSCASGF